VRELDFPVLGHSQQSIVDTQVIRMMTGSIHSHMSAALLLHPNQCPRMQSEE
jgi:hypothetical protein